ncbi:MAG: hypothetical protein R3292_10025 [Alcanivorax sp.]|nr:hypothetical protein [Alcanivorax sp.]
MNELGIPEHLIWKLNDFDNHTRAIDFIKQFQNTLCVYSAPVEQLYTNYDISLPQDDERSLIILPNPYAYHDTFNNINEQSVHPTGMYIVPGDLFGNEGLYLTLRLLKTGKRVMKPVPLKVGLWALMKKETQEVPFLPVITKGDLRAFRKDFPCLHLHRIQPSKLSDRSSMEVKAIQKVIREKLKVYL